MQNPKESIEYVCFLLRHFGIHYVTAEDFRQAKHSTQKALQGEMIARFQRLLFDLCLLHLSAFKLKLKQYDFRVKEHKKLCHFVLYYLYLINCPLVVIADDDSYISLKMEDARTLLLTFAWLAAVSDLFAQFEEHCLESTVRQAKQFGLEASSTHQSALKGQNFGVQGAKQQDLFCQNIISAAAKQQNEGDQAVILHNAILDKFKALEALSNRLQKKQAQQRELMQACGLNQREFALLHNESALRDKVAELEEVNTFVEFASQKMRHQEIFWQWLESVVDADKKEYEDHKSYGFLDEKQIEKFVVPLATHERLHIENLAQVSEQIKQAYEDVEKNIAEFQVYWAKMSIQLQNEKNKQSLEQLEELKVKSAVLIKQVDEQLPQLSLFSKKFDEKFKSDINITLFSHCALNFLDFKELSLEDTRQTHNQQDEEIVLQQHKQKQIAKLAVAKAETNKIFEELRAELSTLVTIVPSLQRQALKKQ